MPKVKYFIVTKNPVVYFNYWKNKGLSPEQVFPCDSLEEAQNDFLKNTLINRAAKIIDLSQAELID